MSGHWSVAYYLYLAAISAWAGVLLIVVIKAVKILRSRRNDGA